MEIQKRQLYSGQKNIGRKVMDRKDNKMKILRVIATLLVVIGHSNFYLISTIGNCETRGARS